MQFRSFLLAYAGVTAASCAAGRQKDFFLKKFSEGIVFAFSFLQWETEVLSLVSIKPWYLTGRQIDPSLFAVLHTLNVSIELSISASTRTEWVETAQNCWSLGLVVFHCVASSAEFCESCCGQSLFLSQMLPMLFFLFSKTWCFSADDCFLWLTRSVDVRLYPDMNLYPTLLVTLFPYVGFEVLSQSLFISHFVCRFVSCEILSLHKFVSHFVWFLRRWKGSYFVSAKHLYRSYLPGSTVDNHSLLSLVLELDTSLDKVESDWTKVFLVRLQQ